MRALTFWKVVAMDEANLLEQLISLLRKHNIMFCVVGGHAVNAYVEPVVTLDLDLVVAIDQIDKVMKLLTEHFQVKRFEHSLNISLPNSDLRAQIQTDTRYADFIKRASEREVLGMFLPVAALEDVLQGKVWAAQDLSRRASKRQKDLADIARLLEAYPELRDKVPQEIIKQLVT